VAVKRFIEEAPKPELPRGTAQVSQQGGSNVLESPDPIADSGSVALQLPSPTDGSPGVSPGVAIPPVPTDDSGVFRRRMGLSNLQLLMPGSAKWSSTSYVARESRRSSGGLRFWSSGIERHVMRGSQPVTSSQMRSSQVPFSVDPPLL
jgi:hypothetical protein